jgi:hypothetical protein
MERDLNLIRDILLKVEAAQGPLKFPDPDEMYQVDLLIEAGMVTGKPKNTTMFLTAEGYPPQPPIIEACIFRLTWEGHDFLDAARDPGLWQKASEKFIMPAVSFTFSIIKDWLKHEIKERLGMK